MAHISDLPTEILLDIFRLYLGAKKQKHLLNVIAKVCVSWKDICFEKSLWEKYDGTPTFENMIYFSRKGCLSDTKELILSKTNHLKGTDEEELFKGVKNIEVIAFSNVKKISKETLSIVAQNCTKIKKIQIGCPRSKKPLRLSYKMLMSFFPAIGCGIVKIDLSYCHISNFLKCLHCISDCCPNLQYLHLMHIFRPSGIFPTKHVQMHCPKLKGLYLDQNVMLQKEKHPSGFPDLEEFTYVETEICVFNDKAFECVLFNSPKLKFLNITNCYSSGSFVSLLPACSIEYLNISRSRAPFAMHLCNVLKKWSHTLKEVNISYGKSFVRQSIINLITTPAESPLEFLNLNFTPTTLDLVEKVIENCKHLETLKLEGCRNIPRGMKKTYSSKSEIADLSEKMKAYKPNHPCGVNFNTYGDALVNIYNF